MAIFCLKEVASIFWPAACICRAKVAYTWSMPTYAGLCMRTQGGRQSRIPLSI